MHLKKTKRNGRVYLSIVQNYRENGATKTKTIETIGYADAYADVYPDPIAHFEDYTARLNEEQRRKAAPIEFSFPRDCTIDANRDEAARWGAGLALAYLDALEAKKPLVERLSKRDVEDDAVRTDRVFELFAAERVLHAAPKRETWERCASFPRQCPFTLVEAYQALPAIAAHDRAIATRMRAAYERIRPDHAPLSCAHVVLETFTFADTDDVDSAPAKHAHGRLSVSLAMILDEDGMPAGYRLIDANPDPTAIRSLAADIKQSLGVQRIVLVAGRLAHAVPIMKALLRAGDGFIMHRSLASTDDLQNWAADDQGYTTSRSGNYRIKSRVRSITAADIAPRPDEAGAPREDAVDASWRGSVRDIVLWGRDYALRRRADAAGNALEGYAGIVTSEVDLAASEVFHLYRELWRLVEPFQVLESDFSPSPYPTPRDDHMRAHFAICYAAFFALRLMRSDLHWRYNAAQVADALVRMEGSYLSENWFLFGYRSPVTDAIEQAAGVDAARRLRTRQDIRTGIAQARRHICAPKAESAQPEA